MWACVHTKSLQLCPTPCHPMDHSLLLCPWDFSGKNTGVGCHALLQGIFLTQGLNPGLLHCRRILYHLSHLGSPSNNYLTIIHHENSTEFYLMEIYPICMGDTPLSMRFSRQEYWSGVPLPSPDTLKNLYILG